MTILKIYTFPDSMLRNKAEDVTVFDEELNKTTDSMFETMYLSNGIGLAAIQVGILKQIVVIDLKCAEEDKSLREPNIFINPKIVERSGTTVSEEGCLSVIDFRGDIKRSEKITVEYQGVKGEHKLMAAEGMMSICLQHEMDHLNGVLFIDHLPLLKQKMVKKRLKKLAQSKG
mgnify:CR=1 FL=1